MAHGGRHAGAVLFALALCLQPIHAAISADPACPYQWLNITGLLQGTARPPGLKDAAMGYDKTSRSIIIFGGEASSTVPQGQTYLLDLDTLTWSVPSSPATLTRTPPARSAAVFGGDAAASNRNGFVVIGGKGADGSALDDVWEFDWTNHFWSQVSISNSGPSARWGSSGGIDPRVPPQPDRVLPGPNNTFWLWGGSDGKSTFTDLWRLNISGTLSSNLPDNTVASWEQLPLDTLPGVEGQGGSVIFQQIVTSGGCNGTLTPDDSCAVQATYVINAGGSSGATDAATLNCPAPRFSPVVVPNGNPSSTTFSSQMVMLLGTFNTSLWDDGDGLRQGEVALMDVMSQSWTRILPSGDPGTSGKEAFPSPREGAVAVWSSQPLVGDDTNPASDILVFGGKDEAGNYLSEVWILRGYNAVVTQADPKWSGLGDGKLQTGVNATGTGVENTFIVSCASSIAPSTPISSTSNSTSSSNSSSPSGGGVSGGGVSGGSVSSDGPQLGTSPIHKLLSPISIALLLPSFLLFRFTATTSGASSRMGHYLSVVLITVVFGLGIASIATSFTSAAAQRPLTTSHGRAGISLFVGLYGLVPLLAILHASIKHAKPTPVATDNSRKRADSDVSEKDQLPRNTPSPTMFARPRTQSWGPSSWRKVREDSMSVDSGSVEMGDAFLQPAPAQRSFEVLNRPARTRRASSRQGSEASQYFGSHSYGDADWLNRRRSLNAVGELDFPPASAALVPAPPPSTPGTLLDPPLQSPPLPSTIPPLTTVLLRLLFHTFLLAFCVFTLVTLWSKAPKGAFAAFLAWTAAFYAILVTSAWSGKPEHSTLSLFFGRLRTEPQSITAPRTSVSETLPETDENAATFPYMYHRPTHRRTMVTDPVGPQTTTDTEEEDDDRAEDEMRRRDISIVTSYPKRALRITNPS